MGASSPVSTGPPAFLQASMPQLYMRRVGEARILGGRNSHGRERSPNRARTRCAVRSPAATSRNMPPARGFSPIRGIGRVQRARQRAVLGAFAVFTKIDQQKYSGRPRLLDSLAALSGQTLFGKIILMQADMHIGRTPHPSSSGWVNSNCPSFDIFIHERTCSRGLKAFLADGRDGIAL